MNMCMLVLCCILNRYYLSFSHTGMANEVSDSTTMPYGEHTISLERPWRRVTMHDVVKEEIPDFEFDLNDPSTLDAAKAAATAAGVPDVQKLTTVGYVLNACFEELCEPKLIQPTFVIDYPVEVSPLSNLIVPRRAW